MVVQLDMSIESFEGTVDKYAPEAIYTVRKIINFIYPKVGVTITT